MLQSYLDLWHSNVVDDGPTLCNGCPISERSLGLFPSRFSSGIFAHELQQ